MDGGAPQHSGQGGYEDVMKHRGPEAEAVQREAMAKNRSYGVSSRPKVAGPSESLSISAEDEAIFDAALEAGTDDVKKMDKASSDVGDGATFF